MLLKCTLNVLKDKCCRAVLLPKRCASESAQLMGRDFINPQDFTPRELTTFLWSGLDFKHSDTTRNRKILQNISNCNGTVIMKKPHINSQLSITSALRNLGCTPNEVIDNFWDLCNVSDLGRALTSLTNIIVTVDSQHESVEALRDGASVPVINFNSSSYQMIECLANIMAVQEYYCFLKGLKICWIGPLNAALNTYIYMSSKLQMNMQFLITSDENSTISRDMLNTAVKSAVKSGTQIKQCCDVKEAIYRAHIIITTMHSFPEFQITNKLLSEAAVNWVFLHHLPRSSTEVCPEIFSSENSLVWEAYENQMWILMAVAAHLLKAHVPACKRPDFEGNNVCAEKFYQP